MRLKQWFNGEKEQNEMVIKDYHLIKTTATCKDEYATLLVEILPVTGPSRFRLLDLLDIEAKTASFNIAIVSE